jgi:hypothetical protein
MPVTPTALKRSKDWLGRLFDCKSNISRKKILGSASLANTFTLLGIIHDVVRGRIPLVDDDTNKAKKRLARKKSYLRDLIGQRSQLRMQSK